MGGVRCYATSRPQSDLDDWIPVASGRCFVDLLLPIAIDGALYAAVTGIALLAMSRRDSAARKAGALAH